MYISRIFSALIIAFLLTAVPAGAQEFLQYFGSDCFVLVEIEARSLAAAVPAEQMSRIKSYSLQALGFDWTERFDSIVLGVNASSLDGTPRDSKP